MTPAPFINSALVDLARRDDLLIVFPHAQRTGGKALRRVFGAVYGPGAVYVHSTPIAGSKNWRDVTPTDLAGSRVYTGPSNYADLNKGRPTAFVGLLRHPLYRAVSIYLYCREREDHRLHPIARRNSLEDFYPEASKEYPVYLRNTQCLRICGKASVHKASAVIRSRYIGVGFQDDIAGFGRALGEVFGWQASRSKPPIPDEGRYGSLITPKFRDMVLSESAEDLKLYNAIASGIWPAPRTLSSILGSAFRARA